MGSVSAFSAPCESGCGGLEDDCKGSEVVVEIRLELSVSVLRWLLQE